MPESSQTRHEPLPLVPASSSEQISIHHIAIHQRLEALEAALTANGSQAAAQTAALMRLEALLSRHLAQPSAERSAAAVHFGSAATVQC
mmetsp:Transcript_37804/g.75772  ORF Transcript_37804/g.75772 Transcript_37804/m.75772 type:complete len:89 (+) Transcript_37804:1118-1384(+)